MPSTLVRPLDDLTAGLFLDLGRRALHHHPGQADATLPSGSWTVWGGRLRAYEARAATPLIGFRVDFETFLALLESQVEVGINMLRAFARLLLASGASLPERTMANP
jgi:hypothetical protein